MDGRPDGRPRSFCIIGFRGDSLGRKEIALTSYRNLHRFAVFTACCTFLLVIAGGLVTSTQSGLSVPDWPTTYGRFMFAFPLDQMVGGIFFEHSHRMIASVVGFFTVVLALWLWRREDRRWVRVLGYTALGTVIGQGLLGGLTVLFLLPTAISVAHATLAQSFLVIVSSLALFTSQWWRSADRAPHRPLEGSSTLGWFPILMTGCMYMQLILGALMRHSDAGLAVPDFPLAYGQVFPSLNPQAVAGYNTILNDANIRLAGDGAVTAGQIVIHMMHRFGAATVAVMVALTSYKLFRTGRSDRRCARFAWLLVGLVALQVSLGALTIISRKAVDITTAHVAVGALLLVASTMTALYSYKIHGVPSRRHSHALSPKGAIA